MFDTLYYLKIISPRVKMELKHNTESIYPKLPSAPAEYEGQSYRLQRINEIHKILEGEKEERASLSKKYHRAVKIVDGIDVALIGTTMGLGIGGLGLLSTIVAAPIVIVMEGVALGTGALSIVGKYVNKKFSAKAEKHERIKTTRFQSSTPFLLTSQRR